MARHSPTSISRRTRSGQAAHARRSPAHRRQHRQAAGDASYRASGFCRSVTKGKPRVLEVYQSAGSERSVQSPFMQDGIYISCRRGRHRSRRRIGFMYRRLLSAASAAFLLSVFCVDGASAAGGCGPGFHRGPYGACRPNGPVVVAPVAPVVVVPAVVAPGPVVCGVGFRWHPRLRRCVVL